MGAATELTPTGRKKRGPKPSSKARRNSQSLLEISRMKPRDRLDLTDAQCREALAIAEQDRKSEDKAYRKYIRQMLRGKPRKPFSPARQGVRPLAGPVEQVMAKYSNGVLAVRCLDNRFWMALRSMFQPMDDKQWDWFRQLSWKDMQAFYESGCMERQINRELKRKRDPEPALLKQAFH